jgi:hypothetical protein
MVLTVVSKVEAFLGFKTTKTLEDMVYDSYQYEIKSS